MQSASLVTGTVNFRDIGSIPLADGKITRPGIVFRSDALGLIGDEGAAQLELLGVRTIIDLRSATEQERLPDPFLPGSDAHHLPMLDANMNGMAEAVERGEDPLIPTLAELYEWLLASNPQEFVEVMQLIAHSPGASVVHCSAGKDRTGIAIALLLGAVGASDADIVANYAMTQTNLAGPWAERMFSMVEQLGVTLTDPIRSLIADSPASAMADTLAWLHKNDGGAAAYLRTAGLSEGDLALLREKMTRDA